MRERLRTEPPAELWRDTADLIYLLDNPIVREAFFPNGPQTLTVSPAQSEDEDAILRLAVLHDGAQSIEQLTAWWLRQKNAFHTVRDSHQALVGFYCLAPADTIDPLLLVTDPVTVQWWRHLQKDPVPRGQRVLFLRRWLAADEGELPGPVQAACWLDIKRTYLELRPALRRVYMTLRDMGPYASVATKLGFRRIDEVTLMDNAEYAIAMLDFGPASVDGWIAGILGMELGAEQSALDVGSREFVMDRKRVALTRKEFALIEYLSSHSDRVVSRDELLNDIWGWKFEGSSNVVDAIVAGLRRKLGPRGTIIETVRGLGYRYRGSDT
jgi:hypothetical protein